MLTQADDPLAGLDPARLFAAVVQQKTIGLAVSGGADSLALMVLIAAWPDRPRTIVYTLDHALRPEAQAEAAMVVAEAKRLGLEARLLRWDGEKPANGKQAAARMARYRLIGEAMAQDDAAMLLTAHHRRDQAETVLMRMAHGSGVSGLGGMHDRAELMGIAIVRPLLDVSAETLATIVARAGLVPVVDPSNADPAYERTRWRQALPDFASLGLTETRLAQLARRLQRIDALAERATADFLAHHARLDPLGVVHIDRARFAEAEPEIGIRAMLRAVEVVSGRACAALGRIERLHADLLADPTTTETLSGAVVRSRGDTLLVYREAGRMAASEQALTIHRATHFDNRFNITANTAGLTVAPASGWTRHRFEDWAGTTLEVPVSALVASPVVTAGDGRIIAVGAMVKGDEIAIRLGALTDRY